MKPVLYPNMEAERVKRRLTQEDAAKAFGVSRRTYRTWVTTGNIPSGKLEIIAAFYECSYDYLLKRDNQPRAG